MSQPERKLGTWPIFVIAVSAMTPLTIVAGALPLGYGQVGEKGIPVAYMLVAAVLGVFAVGLAAMARHVPNSGAFYAYAAIGLSRPLGVGTAFVALLAYNAMQIGLYGAFGVAAHNALAIFGIDVSWIILALLGWALIAVLGRLDIDLNARILTVLVCAEVLIVLIFDSVMIGNPAGGAVTFDTLNPALLASAGGVSLLVAAIAGMVGFEAPLVYAAEARDPRRTIARAIGFTLLVAAFLYGGTAWAMSVVAGPDQIVAVAADHLDDLFFFLPEPYLPTVIVDLGRIFFATSLFAAMLAFHHTVARYGLTVAREGVLPQALATTRRGVPVAASIAQSALAFVVLVIFAIGAWNPTTDLFFFGTVSGGLGVLILMTIASVAVVRYFRRNPSSEIRWRRSIAPWISTVFLWLVLLITVAFFGDLLGSDNPAKIWSPVLSFLIVLIIGIVWGKKLKTQQPEVYAVIGTGQPPATREGAASPTATGTTWTETSRPAREEDLREGPEEARAEAERDREEQARDREEQARDRGTQADDRGTQGRDRGTHARDRETQAGVEGTRAEDVTPGTGARAGDGDKTEDRERTDSSERAASQDLTGGPDLTEGRERTDNRDKSESPARADGGERVEGGQSAAGDGRFEATPGGEDAPLERRGESVPVERQGEDVPVERREGTASVVDNRIENPVADTGGVAPTVAGDGVKRKPSPRPRTARPRKSAAGTAGQGTADAGPAAGSGDSAAGGAVRRTPSPRKRAAGGQSRRPDGAAGAASSANTPSGADGTPGAGGAPGANGTSGASGAPGVGGAPGANGTSGANGAPGVGGAPGVAPRIPRSRAAADDEGEPGSGSTGSGASGSQRRPPRPRAPRAPEQTPAPESDEPR
ncbi:amino acid permease [Actinoplanes couchii]|nr:amino acid permease [Actinoplanes couchii]MDR6321019.1 amino acid transporter [Actinoplanes couchii]